MSLRTALVALCAGALVAGCSGGGEEPEPLPPVPSASPTQAAALPLPSEAAAETPQGAAAFTRYYFGDLVNDAYDRLDAAAVAEFSTSDCQSCANIVSDVERLAAAGLRVDGQRFKIAFAEAPPANPDGSVFVDFRYSSDPYVERNAAGEVVRTEPAQIDQDAQVKLVRRGGSWAVDGIRTV